MTEANLPPECLDDDPPQHCYTHPPTTEYCDIDARSARGYCPDESDGHAAELCAFGDEFEDASFCKGDSDQGHGLLEEVSQPTPPTTLPETGVEAVGIFVFALLLLWFGVTLWIISTWRPQ